MKKSFIVLVIIIVCFLITGCPPGDTVAYCPYCGYRTVGETETGSGVYKCSNEKCGKTFGAKEIKKELREDIIED
jgi:DNA-directed RNA polymerase subunit RPC12/RpoP